MEAFEVRGEGWEISCDPGRLDLDVIHGFLARAYWSEGIPREVVARAVANSLCFGVFVGARQVGFARAVSDRATYAYVADVFMDEEFRGRGLSQRLMEAVLAHPELQGLRRWGLVTHDAQGLYQRFGFTPVAHPERHMEIHRPGLYARG
jgi:GNAT superfamily N-acetyltransferase